MVITKIIQRFKGYNNTVYNVIFSVCSLLIATSVSRDVWLHGPVLSYKLRDIVGFGLVEMAISTNPKPTIYRNLYENTDSDFQLIVSL